MRKIANISLIALSRTLGVLPFAVLSLIGAFILWVRWMGNFVWYGGEAIAYTKKASRKTINDVFHKLLELDDKLKQ